MAILVTRVRNSRAGYQEMSALMAWAVLIAVPSVAAERTWSATDGRFKVTGEFVRAGDGTVQIRLADGRLVGIDLDKLSPADREFVASRDSGKKAQSRGEDVHASDETAESVTPEAVEKPSTAGSSSSAIPRSAAGEAEVAREVVAEGSGLNKEDAVKDACRSAIRQVVGEVVDSETVVRNDQLIKDEVLLYSDGIVDRHEILDERREGGIVRVTMRARVSRRKLVQKLVAAKITVKELADSGENVVARLATEREARKEAAAMVAKAFVGFPSDQLEARVVDWKAVDEKDGGITLAVKVEVTPAPDAYKAFQERLCQRLSDIAKLDDGFTTTFPTQPAGWNDPCQLPRIEGSLDARQLAKLMPAAAEAIETLPGRAPKFPMIVAVATLVSADHTRIDWRYFVLDAEVGNAVLGASRRSASCKLTFQDTAGEAVAVDRFDPREDVFPLQNGTARIPWNQFLIRLFCRYDTRTDLYDLYRLDWSDLSEEHMRRNSQSPALAFVAPVFYAGSGEELEYVPRLTLTRHVRLTEEEVRPIKKVKCELTFRKAMQ